MVVYCKLKYLVFIQSSRLAAFDLLLDLTRDSEKNFTELQNLLLKHHSSGKSLHEVLQTGEFVSRLYPSELCKILIVTHPSHSENCVNQQYKQFFVQFQGL